MMPGWAPGGGALSRFGDAVTAVVTGGNRGLGLAFCRQLLRVPRVTRIHATCRSPETAEDLAALSESEPSRLRILPMDVTKESSIAQMAARVGDDGRPVSLVINVAGLLHRYSADGDGPGPERRLADIDPQWLEESFRVNASGPLLVAKHLQPLLPRRAHAVFASISARVGSIGDNRLGGWYAYRGSKAAQNMFTRGLGIELRRRAAGIVCVGLHPGTTDTGLSRPFQKGVPPDKLFTADQAAGYLLAVIDGLDSDDNGSFFAWDGTAIPW